MIFGWIDLEWEQIFKVVEVIGVIILCLAFFWTIVIPIWGVEYLKNQSSGI